MKAPDQPERKSGSLEATYGGPGWVGRSAPHRLEVQAGRVWPTRGVHSEVAPLREVLLSWPSDTLAAVDDVERWLMLASVDLARMRRQVEALVERYEALGVRAHLFRPASPPPPNFIFLRDLFFMTPEGAVVGRMAAEARSGEERFAARALAGLEVPILMTMRGEATFEGADALWLDEGHVLVGTGRRTNDEACRALAPLLADMGARLVPVPLPRGVQHLLGCVNFVDERRAVLREDRLEPALLDALRAHGVETLVLPADAEVREGLAMNFVTLEPDRVLMPAGCPQARRRLETAGITCEEADVSEAIRAAGALGCLTGILYRQ